MDANQFREALLELGITQVDFARLVTVTPRTVNMWATTGGQLPGPAEAYLNLLRRMPKALLNDELKRLGETPMHEGMYQFNFQGANGTGVGIMVLQAGVAYGTDGGVRYDGKYAPNSAGQADLSLKITVPPGTPLVQGVPAQKMAFSFDLDAVINLAGNTALNIQTPFGPVRASVTFLRPLPSELAA